VCTFMRALARAYARAGWFWRVLKGQKDREERDGLGDGRKREEERERERRREMIRRKRSENEREWGRMRK
jgi:hypothetical protein